MISNQLYKKEFETLVRFEERFISLYGYHLNRIKDTSLLDRLKNIYDEEKKHLELTKGFIDKLNK